MTNNAVTIIGEITELSDEYLKNLTSPNINNYFYIFSDHRRKLTKREISMMNKNRIKK